MIRYAAFLAATFAVAACGGSSDEVPSMTLQVGPAPAIMRPVDPTVVTPLTPEAEAKIETLRDILDRNSLRRLSNQANDEPAFVSNFANQSHRVHWDLLRRTGFDPLLQLTRLLDGPYATRRVGDQVWYIWPDLAALDAEALEPERLSFSDRARLRELVGDPGIARIRDGQAYPGVRTAIAEDGRWLYFIHQTEDEGEREE
ncbi:MAG: hypothetical protein AAFO63_02560 [Pseudomonadota bacterium]